MESPVVLDKPPEYHRDERGFPFDEEESGAWSDLASRHPDIAARLRQHPAAANWARKRRPSSQTADEFGDSFGTFDRFPFDDIPPEFREHFPSHFNRRFGHREERPQTQAPQSPQPQTSQYSQSPPRQQTTATQTEHDEPGPSQPQPQAPQPEHTSIPQYGLRNTVDLGQKSAADPSLVDVDDRNQRSMSAPPETRNQIPKMSAQGHPEPPHAEQPSQPQKVRNIPIFVEGWDKPVINDNLDGATHFGDTTRPATHTYTQHHPQQPQVDNNYFADEAPPMYHNPPNFGKAFGNPYKSFQRQGAQPFAQQKVFPQTYARGSSPARTQSPRPAEEIKIPVHHDAPKQQKPQQPPPKPQPQPQQPEQPPKQPTPPPTARPQPPDPITQILAIQTDVLNLMAEVENFAGAKKDKRYIYLDEMLTRNLIKLDNIETEGKENIRNARKEAIKCIQKCIAVLEAKAESNANSGQLQAQADTEMNAEGEKAQNGEVNMIEAPKDEAKAETVEEPKPEEQIESTEKKETPQAVDTRPENAETKPENVDKKPKKPSKKRESKEKSVDKTEPMQVDEKGEKEQKMEVDGAASQ
ncbi:hypothetical protein O0L34_g17942 [Tuta absoluta]|nr:hypothetical protein O0L34_g17942 [Tuta absoluta]